MVLMVFSILFQDHEFNATNCMHKHSCAFSPYVQIDFSAFLCLQKTLLAVILDYSASLRSNINRAREY